MWREMNEINSINISLHIWCSIFFMYELFSRFGFEDVCFCVVWMGIKLDLKDLWGFELVVLPESKLVTDFFLKKKFLIKCINFIKNFSLFKPQSILRDFSSFIKNILFIKFFSSIDIKMFYDINPLSPTTYSKLSGYENAFLPQYTY